MVAISSVGTPALSSTAPYGRSGTSPASAGPAGASAGASASDGAEAVALGQGGGSPVYTRAQLAPTYAWERASSDAISGRLAGNVLASAMSGRFAGLGAALLTQLGGDGSDYSQSVIGVAPGAQVNAIHASRFQAPALNQVGLTLTMRSGATVTVTLGSDTDRLAVNVAVTGGTLGAKDRDAVAGLAGAFQTAIDALGETPPRLDLGGLLDTDADLFAAVNLHASIDVGQNQPQTIDFVASDQQRTVSVRGPSGDLDLNVDMRETSTLGTAAQQASAIRHYLQQFDAAKSRGQGDPALMAMFKDAFAALHSHRASSDGVFGKPSSNGIVPASRIALSGADQGMMTGLGDFQASISQTAVASNPMRRDEVDAFSYQVSQHTEISGKSELDRSVHQRQESRLDASFHRSLFGDTALMLTDSPYSQNYYYDQIHDTASSDMSLAYAKGALVQATLTQAADQSSRVQKYELGRLQSDITTPNAKSRTADVLGMIDDAIRNDTYHQIPDDRQRDDVLSSMHDRVLLHASTDQVGNL
ncbi:hypothetical protein [Cupriavidus plantarum]|uniref:hypothetical protein n=1 Tax=Cupriavidus plantarum TaxID=942865 RepID=UPI000E3960D3|nr:hypothetical protein [Cupriavidus plantarum]NYI00134.1 hypothetical protein [Cupriavidus plantarum]REF01940.1 hypothetical protein C7418_0728 [Cupriavidus plantarum]